MNMHRQRRRPARAVTSPRPCCRKKTMAVRRLSAAGLLWLAIGLVGCRDSTTIQTAYGQRRGADGQSVNGTRVLSDMFDAAGFRVYTWKYLSPRLKNYDVVLWAPDDFALPNQKTVDFFDGWLSSQGTKTLIYIGRDFDAAAAYWDRILASAPADQKLELWRRRAQASAHHAAERLAMPAEPDAACEWFTVKRDKPATWARDLTGPWSEGVDGAKADIHVQGLLQVPTEADLQQYFSKQESKRAERSYYRTPDYTPLLSNGEQSLVTMVSKPAWGDNKILVVTNGSFLLNLPLVNHEHRKLAGQLIEACRPGKKVAFLESGAGGPRLTDSDEQSVPADSLRRRVVLAAHWFVLGLVYCFAVFPIFGRPKPLSDNATSEFSQHIDALGELLEETRDVAFAQQQLSYYQPASRREGGTSTERGVHNTPRAGTDISPVEAPSAQPDEHS